MENLEFGLGEGSENAGNENESEKPTSNETSANEEKEGATNASPEATVTCEADTENTEEEMQNEIDFDKEIYELSYEASGGVGVEVNRERYGELRALGLTAREAFLATSEIRERPSDNRAHLGSSVPRCATRPTFGISQRELKEARELFSGASDAEILRLYKRVTAN